MDLDTIKRGWIMLVRSISKIILAGALATAVISPSFAHGMMTPRPCASPQLRCTGECNKQGLCKVYVCSLNKTVESPILCDMKINGCWQPHC
jgi:hypothetical protein